MNSAMCVYIEGDEPWGNRGWGGGVSKITGSVQNQKKETCILSPLHVNIRTLINSKQNPFYRIEMPKR